MKKVEIDLRDLTLDEAEAHVRAVIEEAQADDLALYQVMLADVGGDPADHAAIARLRAEHWRVREQVFEKVRAMVARGGGTLH
jgi:hypothetical protein